MTVVFPAADIIDGRKIPLSGNELQSHDPAHPDRLIWSGTPEIDHVEYAVIAARRAAGPWARRDPEERVALLQRWRDLVAAHVDELADLIAREVGKTPTEARLEAGALAAKVDLTLESVVRERIADWSVDAGSDRTGRCRFRPHGVMAVIGPFNFPAHLPNGQFVPALLAGNTVILKPSELAPAIGQRLGELMLEAGLPPGVFNVVQAGAHGAARLCSSEDVNGILFTGSWAVGRQLLEANVDSPGRLIALELGGNNPAIVHQDADLRLAVIECVRAAFATTGQRCTCTRRIIVHEQVADDFFAAFCTAASTLLIGAHDDEEACFMGPLISESARSRILEAQRELVVRGGRVLLPTVELPREGSFLSAGVVEVDSFDVHHDEEIFGPLVQVTTAASLDEAIDQAGRTRYGLAASIFSSQRETFDYCFDRLSSGCVNWNVGTAGASSRLPFGGIGQSGNHRPAAALAIDSCAYPVASLLQNHPEVAVPEGMTWRDDWLGPPTRD